jgi:hypothetical protein
MILKIRRATNKEEQPMPESKLIGIFFICCCKALIGVGVPVAPWRKIIERIQEALTHLKMSQMIQTWS